MDPLPLLVRHGAAVWIAALVSMVVAAVLGDLARRRRAARKLAASRREALGSPTTRLEGAVGALVTLRGRVDVGGALCARFEDGAPVAAASAGSGRAEAIVTARAEGLRLWTQGGLVRLDGPVDVVVGEVETRTGKSPDRLDAAVQVRIERCGGAWASPDPVVLRSVGAGAEVLVQGVLHRADACDGPGGYRTGGGAFRLAPPPVGEDGTSAGLRLAYDAVPRTGRRASRRPLAAAGAAVSIFGLIFLAAPEIQGVRPIRGETLAALLAATPLYRGRAVAAYTALLDEDLRRGPMDRGRFDELLTLRLDEGRADRAVGLLLDHGQWARAEDLAVRSGLPILAARAAFERGDFERAERLWDERGGDPADGMDLLFGLRVHLLAGDLDGARLAAHRAANELVTAPLRCVASALDVARGDRSAIWILRAGADGDAICAELLTDLEGAEGQVSGEQRLADLQRRWSGAAGAVRGAPSPCFHRLPIADALLGPGREPPRWALVREALAWLEQRPAPTNAERLSRARLAAAMATFESSAGEHDEAIRWAGVMTASAEAFHGSEADGVACVLRRSERETFEAVEASVRLRAGRVEEGRRLRAGTLVAALSRALPVARGDDPDRAGAAALEALLRARAWAGSLADPPAATDDRIYKAAAHGDGAGFAGLVQSYGVSPAQLVRVVGFTNRDARGRDELLAWLRWGTVERCQGCDVAGSFDAVTARLALAEELGDADLAAEIRPIVARFRSAILRRATAAPLLALEEIGTASAPPVQIARGDRHACARYTDATVRCWGANDRGQLGDGTTERRREPTRVPGLEDVEQIAAGGDSTCARLEDGTVRCWGAQGRRGPGGGTTPARVAGLARATGVTVGHDQACASLEGGATECWGAGR